MVAPATLKAEQAVGLYLVVFALMLAGAPFLQGLGLWGVALALCLFQLAPALGIVRANLGSVRAGVGLFPVGVRVWVGATLVGLSSSLVVDWLVLSVQQWIAPAPAQLLRQLKETLIPVDVPLWHVLVIVGLTPAVCEEILFRGVIARSLQKRLGVWGAIFVSAFLFALMHMSGYRFAATFVLGIVLAWLTLVSGSVVPAMLVHGLNNSVVVVFARLGGDGGTGSPTGAFVQIGVVALFVAGLALIEQPARK